MIPPYTKPCAALFGVKAAGFDLSFAPHFRFFNFFLDKKLLPAYSHSWVISGPECQHPLLAFFVLMPDIAAKSFRICIYGQTPRFAGF
jgi:hypothetical protein